MSTSNDAEISQWLREMPIQVNAIAGQVVFPMYFGKILFSVSDAKGSRSVILRANRSYTRQEIERAIEGDSLIHNPTDFLNAYTIASDNVLHVLQSLEQFAPKEGASDGVKREN